MVYQKVDDSKPTGTAKRMDKLDAEVVKQWELLYRYVCPLILHAAVINNHDELVKQFLEKGANVNFTDHNRLTPLHCSAMVENIAITSLLLEHGADIQANNAKDQTPTDMAFLSANYQEANSTLAFLIDEGGTLSKQHWIEVLEFAIENDIARFVELGLKTKVLTNDLNSPIPFILHLMVGQEALQCIR